MRILALSLGIPFPPIGGGLLRTFHLLRALSSEHEIHLVAFVYGDEAGGAPFPIHVTAVPWTWSVAYQQMTGADSEASMRMYELLAHRSDDPWFVSSVDASPFLSVLHRLVREQFDVVLVEGTPMAQYLSVIPRHVPRILDLLDVQSLVARRAVDSAPPEARRARAREAERTLSFEREAVRQSDACLVVSEQEGMAARELLGASHVHVIPNGVDTNFFVPTAPADDSTAILFTGTMNYPPNVDAARYFVAEILPLVRQGEPRATLHIVGSNPTFEVTSLGCDSVIVHGRVPDMRPYYRAAAVVVVPVREGGGTRLKVLEAAASGRAIVSTTLGLEGLDFAPGRDAVVADTAADFAMQVVELLHDAPRRELLGAQARERALRHDWNRIGAAFSGIVQDVAAFHRQVNQPVADANPVSQQEAH
jgi:polysaccharide biosynthesis protein PslH